MGIKEEYQKELQDQLDEWGKDIDKLKAVAEKAKAGLQVEYYKEIDELKDLQGEAQLKLQDLKEESGDAWDDLKLGVELAWAALGDALKSASSRFK